MTTSQAQRASNTPSVWGVYRLRLYQALAAYRFFAFAMGVGVYFVLDIHQLLLLGPRVLVVLVGLATAARVVSPPFHRIHNEAVETALLAGEMVLNLALVLTTGGLESPLLIHSLSPILTASFLAGVSETGTSGPKRSSMKVSSPRQAFSTGILRPATHPSRASIPSGTKVM